MRRNNKPAPITRAIDYKADRFLIPEGQYRARFVRAQDTTVNSPLFGPQERKVWLFKPYALKLTAEQRKLAGADVSGWNKKLPDEVVKAGIAKFTNTTYGPLTSSKSKCTIWLNAFLGTPANIGVFLDGAPKGDIESLYGADVEIMIVHSERKDRTKYAEAIAIRPLDSWLDAWLSDPRPMLDGFDTSDDGFYETAPAWEDD